MRFWTSYQAPLRQAAKIENGKMMTVIPEKPPQTPVRWIFSVGKYKEDLLIGRKASIERYSMDGSKIISSIYHPWIWGLHSASEYMGNILVTCSGIDLCFIMNEEGTTLWEWWGWKDGYSKEPVMLKKPDWQQRQLSEDDHKSMDGSQHLNSANEDEGRILVTFYYSKVVLALDPNVSNPKSEVVARISEEGPHDFKYDRRDKTPILVGGVKRGFYINGKIYEAGGAFVKRVVLYEEDKYLVTYDKGVSVMDRGGNILESMSLPRPFGAVIF